MKLIILKLPLVMFLMAQIVSAGIPVKSVADCAKKAAEVAVELAKAESDVISVVTKNSVMFSGSTQTTFTIDLLATLSNGDSKKLYYIVKTIDLEDFSAVPSQIKIDFCNIESINRIR